MSKILRTSMCAALLLSLLATPAFAEKLGVNGTLKKINDRAKIAVKPDGNALVVWSNSNSKTNDKGVIYGREILKTDAGYVLGDLVQISDKKGSNQHPEVEWINSIGAYVITWDTSFRDLNELSSFDHIMDRPLPGAHIFARTYLPAPPGVSGSAPEDRLGAAEQISDPAFELNVLPHITDLEGGEVLFLFLGSDESTATTGAFKAGLWGATYSFTAGTTLPSNQSLSFKNRKMMMNGFFDKKEGLAVITDSFVLKNSSFNSGASASSAADSTVIAGGAYMKFNFDGDLFFPSGVGAIYRINPNTLTVDNVISSEEFNPKGEAAPLKANGQIAPLTMPSGVAANDFTIIGTSNLVKILCTFRSNFNPMMNQTHGLISDKSGDVVDQFLFRIEQESNGPAAPQSGVWVLHHTNKGVFKYRAIGPNGKPSGGSKKAFKTKKGRLLYMDVAVNGSDVLVAWTERKTKKRTLIFFDGFTIN